MSRSVCLGDLYFESMKCFREKMSEDIVTFTELQCSFRRLAMLKARSVDLERKMSKDIQRKTERKTKKGGRQKERRRETKKEKKDRRQSEESYVLRGRSLWSLYGIRATSWFSCPETHTQPLTTCATLHKT